MGATEYQIEEAAAQQSFWRKENPVRDAVSQAIVKGGMFGHQRSWWELPNFYKALVTGYGGGKTLIAGKRAISMALHNAPVPHVWVSPSFKVARRTAIPTIRNLLWGKKSLYREAIDFTYNKSEFEFTIYYKNRIATIWVLSGEDPDSLRGPNVGSANIDEPFIMDREVFDQIVARVRDPDAKLREITLTGTPEDLNWGYDICEGEEKDNFDIGVVHATSRENLALPDKYVDRLEGALTDRAAEAYVEGKFISLSEGLVYYAFSDANVIAIDNVDGWDMGAGMDFNVDPMAAAVFVTRGGHIHFVEEIELPNADTEYMCQVLREGDTGRKVGNYGKGYGDRLKTIYPDASGRSRHSVAPGGKSDFWYIKKAGFELGVHSQNPARKDRYNAVNGKFKPKSSVLTMPDGSAAPMPATCTIDPRCKRMIRYLKGYSHENLNTDHGKKMSHLLDAMGYPTAFLFPVRTPFEQVPLIGS